MLNQELPHMRSEFAAQPSASLLAETTKNA